MEIGEYSDLATAGSDISTSVTIGKYSSIAPNVQMHSLIQHACINNPKLVSTYELTDYPAVTSEGGITIGNDVWIGRNAILLGNITIGDGAIIGAFSVVAKDIPPYAVVVGNPAVIKRYRFNDDQISELLRIKWWDWERSQIEAKSEELKDIDLLLANNKV